MSQTCILSVTADLEQYEAFTLEEKLEWHIRAWNLPTKQFRSLDEEFDMECELFNVLEVLGKKSALNDIERLDAAVRVQQPEYKEYCFYFAQILIPLHLSARINATNEELKSVIEPLLSPFVAKPAKNFEILEDVLKSLLCFNRSFLAVDLCKNTYNAVAKSKELMFNPEGQLAAIIMMDELQKMFMACQPDGNYDWDIFEKKMSLIDLEFSAEELAAFESVLAGQFDHESVESSFQKRRQSVLSQLRLLFCCYMFEREGRSFASSMLFVGEVFSMLGNIRGREKCSLKDFFSVKKDIIANYLPRMGLFENSHLQAYFLAGLPLFFQFLQDRKVISKQVYDQAMKSLASL